MVGNTLLVQTGEYGQNLGHVQLTVSNGKVERLVANVIKEADTANVTPNAEVSKIIEEIKAENSKVTGVIVGENKIKLEGDRKVVRAGESNLGNLITDAMVFETGADLAITNGGGIRASIDVGNVTMGDVITVLPFGNYVVTVEMTGAQIFEALENGVRDYPEARGAFSHVGGISYSFDPSQTPGSRITGVFFKDGNPMMASKKYIVATNDFMAAGGDQYTSIKAGTEVGQFSGLDEILIKYFKHIGAVSYEKDGRITQKTAEEVQKEHPAKMPVTETENSMPTKMDKSIKEEPMYYTVKAGDTVKKISAAYSLDWEVIVKLNELKNPNLILVGQTLRIK